MYIVEYTNEFANATARMWNESKDHFFEGSGVETAEERDEREKTQGNIVTLLAIENERVIGYCGVAESTEDSEALYIPLLNTHPEYLEKGIGKALVFEAIQRTIAGGWKRIDLHTWPGNTKAVPFYKKIGFFWAKKEGTTHLMNFLPLILTHAYLKKMITLEDCYEALKRNLSVAPDEERVQDLNVFKYSFFSNSEEIEVGIELNSKKIYKLITSDFEVEWTIPSQLLENEKNSARLIIKNKTNKPLHFESIHEPNELELNLDLRKKLNAYDTQTIFFPFNMADVRNESKNNSKDLFNYVRIPLIIEGIPCPLVCGYQIINPIQAFVKLKPEISNFPEKRDILLEWGSKVCSEISPKIRLKGTTEEIEIIEKEFYNLTTFALSESPIHIPVIVKSAGVASLYLQVEFGMTSYDIQIPVEIESPYSKGVIESDTELIVVNGFKRLHFNNTNFEVYLSDRGKEVGWKILYPNYSTLLSRSSMRDGWDSINTNVQTEVIEITVTYKFLSHDISMVLLYKWFNNGEIELIVFSKNNSDSSVELKHVLLGILIPLENITFPLLEGPVRIEELRKLDTTDLPLEKIVNNWSYYSWGDNNLGIKMDENASLVLTGYDLSIRKRVKTLKPGEDSEDFVMRLYPDIHFSDANFIRSIDKPTNTVPFDWLSFRNNGFAEYDEEVELVLRQMEKEYDEGVISYSNGDVQPFIIDSHKSTNLIYKRDKNKLSTELLTSKYVGKHRQKIKNLQIISVRKDMPIECSLEKEEGQEVHVVKNGTIIFKAAESYFPAIYSLSTNKTEWLDNLFPKAGPKSWWNPWPGGFMSIPKGIQLFTIDQLERVIEFTELEDQWNQVWKGIKITIFFENHNLWGNAKFVQYYVTLPGSSILVHFTEIIDCPLFTSEEELLSLGFFKNKDRVFYPNNNNDELLFLKGSHIEIERKEVVRNPTRLYDKNTNETVVIMSSNQEERRIYYDNNETFMVYSKENIVPKITSKSFHSKLQIYVVTDSIASTEGWNWVEAINFKRI